MEDTAVKNATYRAGVGHHDRNDLERDDGIESNARADVDERKKHGEYASEGNGICWNLHGGMHMRDPLGEWQAVVSGEGKGLTRGGGIEGNVGGNNEDQNKAGEPIDAGGGHGGAEDIDKGVTRGVVQGIIDAFDREEVTD